MGSSLSKGFGKTAKQPNLRDKLSQAFLSAFDADFQEHGLTSSSSCVRRTP